MHRVEAGAGILEDEADVAAAARGARPRPGQSMLPGDLRRRGQQAGDRQRQRALARAAFADHRQALAGAEIEIDAVERGGVAAAR